LLDTAAPRLRKNDRGRWHLDLSDLIIRALTMTGVRIQNIENVGGCTVDNPDLFFSHRRDRGQTGRHIAAIALVEEDSK
ncbi:MAG: laccase domain-containing protein, partial [Myxococcota bacterium]